MPLNYVVVAGGKLKRSDVRAVAAVVAVPKPVLTLKESPAGAGRRGFFINTNMGASFPATGMAIGEKVGE